MDLTEAEDIKKRWQEYMEEPWTPLEYGRGSIDGQGYTIHVHGSEESI